MLEHKAEIAITSVLNKTPASERIETTSGHNLRGAPASQLGIFGSPGSAAGSRLFSFRLPGLPSAFFWAVGLRFLPPDPLPPMN
jgi:hypothetical protein